MGDLEFSVRCIFLDIGKNLEYPEKNPKEHRENIQTSHGKKEDIKSAAD